MLILACRRYPSTARSTPTCPLPTAMEAQLQQREQQQRQQQQQQQTNHPSHVACPATASRDTLLYTSHFCEENIYQLLLHHATPLTLPNYTVIFLSNPHATIPLFSQKLARSPIVPVVWDYHVILAHRLPDEGAVIYDFDTTVASFPASFEEYYTATFEPENPFHNGPREEEYASLLEELRADKFKVLFRLVPGDTFLKQFSSDRHHMRGRDGSWMHEPPVWDVVVGEDAETQHTLSNFLDFSKGVETDDGYGRIVDRKRFLDLFSRKEH